MGRRVKEKCILLSPHPTQYSILHSVKNVTLHLTAFPPVLREQLEDSRKVSAVVGRKKKDSIKNYSYVNKFKYKKI